MPKKPEDGLVDEVEIADTDFEEDFEEYDEGEVDDTISDFDEADVEEDTGPKKKVRRASVPSYAKASEDDQELLDILIDTIDMEDTSTITRFGADPIQKLAAIHVEITREFDEATANMGNAKTQFEHINRLTAEHETYVREQLGLKGQSKKLLSKIWGLAQSIKDRFSGEEEDDFEEAVEALENALPQMLHTLRESASELSQTLASYENVNRTVEKLGKERIHTLDSLGYYISAIEEKIRRVDEEDIPLLKAELAETQDLTIQLRLAELENNRGSLERKKADLYVLKTEQVNAIMGLGELKKSLGQMHEKIYNFMQSGAPAVEAKLTEMKLAVTIMRQAQELRATDELNRQTRQQRMAAIEMAVNAIGETHREGLGNLAELAQENDKLKDLMLKQHKLNQTHERQLGAEIEKLKASEKRLLGAAAKTNNGGSLQLGSDEDGNDGKLLLNGSGEEDAPTPSKPKGDFDAARQRKRKAPPPPAAGNDNGGEDPLEAARKKQAARKRGKGGPK